MKDLQDIVHDLKGRGVALKATEQPIDTGMAASKAFLDIRGVFAEFDPNLRRERRMEGIAARQGQGRVQRSSSDDRCDRGHAITSGWEAWARRHRETSRGGAFVCVPCYAGVGGVDSANNRRCGVDKLIQVADQASSGGRLRVLKDSRRVRACGCRLCSARTFGSAGE